MQTLFVSNGGFFDVVFGPDERGYYYKNVYTNNITKCYVQVTGQGATCPASVTEVVTGPWPYEQSFNFLSFEDSRCIHVYPDSNDGIGIPVDTDIQGKQYLACNLKMCDLKNNKYPQRSCEELICTCPNTINPLLSSTINQVAIQ